MPTDFEIIDFHCHPFIIGEENICSYEEGPDSYEVFSDDILRAGISMFCGSVVKRNADFSTFEDIRIMNRHALELRELFEYKYIPGIHIHPNFVDESCAELEYMHGLGVNLIGEIVPYMMGWREYASEAAIEIFKYAGKLGMTVSAHPTFDEDMDKVLEAVPEVNFVFAHPGEKNVYMKYLERMEKYPNAYLDLSGTGLFRYAMLSHGVKRLGSKRFLFGTDFPICNAAMQVGGVLSEHLTGEDYYNIFYANAVSLLNITKE